jgi:Short C-terminal domain
MSWKDKLGGKARDLAASDRAKDIAKKTAKGTLAVGILGGSLAAEKAAKGIKSSISGGEFGWKARGSEITEEEVAVGLLFHGMSHEKGRNAHVRLYADRIERVKPRSRVNVVRAAQDNEVIPIRRVTGVNIMKDGMLLSMVEVRSMGDVIPFRFRHNDAQAFKDALIPLILTDAKPPSADGYDQLRKLAELHEAGILSDAEFEAKKAQLLERM